MGVTSLWQIVQPCARPIKIDTLNKKRLAIDASIWVYHFLKAVRDKEGNALRNSHVVGFYRRICKLLFFGIKPVFVFDGGAPALKRQTISGRKQRREGRREDAVRTAGKLLALQMQRRAEEEEQKRKEGPRQSAQDEEPLPENLVYVDELQMTQQERQQARKFKKRDQYHLPDLEMPLSEMGGPNDPRVMSMEELEQYARQFDTGEDINVYDFSKIDFESPFFTSLPATDRYNILNAARLRSRLRMGYSRDQLEAMFPDRMAFSKFQIERVRERNELTQRLMQVGTVEDGTFSTDGAGRVAGEKGREYVLVKNPGVEGGWALGVIGDRDQEEGQKSKPIDVDRVEKQESEDGEEELPQERENETSEELLKRRQAFYKSQAKAVGRVPRSPESEASQRKKRHQEQTLPDDGLFVSQAEAEPMDEDSHTSEVIDSSEDEETQLQIAIAMSMAGADQDEDQLPKDHEPKTKVREPRQRTVESAPSFAKSKGKFSHLANSRSHQAAPPPLPHEPTAESAMSSDDEQMDLQAALAESRGSKYQPRSPRRSFNETARPMRSAEKGQGQSPEKKAFSGPLPFEKLDLGSSLLGKKKMKQIEEDNAGGFEKDLGQKDGKPAAPAPPWFSGDVEKGVAKQRAVEAEDRRKAQAAEDVDDEFEFQNLPSLRAQASEVIDVDALEEKRKAVVNLDSSDDEGPDENISGRDGALVEDPAVRMGDIADKIRAEPPPESGGKDGPVPIPFSTEASPSPSPPEPAEIDRPKIPSVASQPSPPPSTTAKGPFQDDSDQSKEDREDAEDNISWDESDREDDGHRTKHPTTAEDSRAKEPSPSPLAESEEEEEADDVYMPNAEELEQMATRQEAPTGAETNGDEGIQPMSGAADQDMPLDQAVDEFEDVYSDPEDDELMLQLATEAEEHARFASTLNNKTQQQNIEEYERELKALRNQQKKDRRDADEVTHVMIQECQQLLKLFGLPYVTAPMEAEAQCAELVALGLVDGIVTDDSDIFLFGGTRVYKNMFNQAKYVECYLTADLERDFDLTRQKLINIAHLLGSDYTEGLPGVGPVTALEVLTEFPDSLEDFRDWFQAVQIGTLEADGDVKTPFRKKFRKQATKLILPPAFPDRRVDMAYLKPEVDSDPSAFQWGVPDLDALRAFLMATIGWDQARTDEVLVPVIRDMNRRENEGTQANITSFMGAGASVGAGAFAPRVRAEGKSRRMESALERMAERARRKRKGGPDVDALEGHDAVIAAAGSAVDGSSDVVVPQKTKKKRRADVVDEDEDEDEAVEVEVERPMRKKGKRKAKAKAQAAAA